MTDIRVVSQTRVTVSDSFFALCLPSSVRKRKFRFSGWTYSCPMAAKTCSSSTVSSWTQRPVSALVSLPHIAPRVVFS